MGVPQSVPAHAQAGTTNRHVDNASRRDRSVSLVARIKERSMSTESRGDYVVGTGDYVLQQDVRVEAYDTWRSTRTNEMVFRWRPARIRKVVEDSVLVAFDGFSERWDVWLPLREGKVRSPTGGPVLGPDGTLYKPRDTPEPLPSLDGVVAAAPLYQRPVQPKALHPQHIAKTSSGRSHGLGGARSLMRLSLFKKSSRSDDEGDANEDDEFSSAKGEEEISTDEDVDEQENEAKSNSKSDDERKVEIDLIENHDSGVNKSEIVSTEPDNKELLALARIRRTVSTTSSMVVETGDALPPARVPTPPGLGISFPFLRRSFGDSSSKRHLNGENSSKRSSANSNHDSVHPNSDKGESNSGDKSSGEASSSSTPGTKEIPVAAPPVVTQNNKENGLQAKALTPSQIANRGMSGLANLGNTCFMNAVLQSLSHCPPLVERMILEVKPIESAEDIPAVTNRPALVRSDRLARVFSTLLREQWKAGPERFRRPEELKNMISNVAPQFQGSRQQDAQELLICLLDGLHDCLNRIKRRPTYVEMNPPKNLSEADLSFLYWDNYERGNDSFIKDLFCGQLMSRVTCGDCRMTSTSFDVFWDLSLPVPQQDRPANLTDLLKAFCEVEKMSQDCGFKCETCNKMPAMADKQLSIARKPKVMVLHLKRFSHEKSGTKKITTTVTFPLKGLRLGDDEATYDLVAVVNHLGSFASGHYTADVYNPLSKTWFHADDTNFSPTTRIGPNAYLLFYVESHRSERAVRALCNI